MKIYQDNGYPDIERIVSYGYPYIFMIGGRGTGKTCSTLMWARKNKKHIFFLRRTGEDAITVNNQQFSPFNTPDELTGMRTTIGKISKNLWGLYNNEENEPFGYSAALVNISKIRGFDASIIDTIIYDEFIPEKHNRPIKDEASAILNAYETINRNRELNGRPPVQMICLANSNDITNPVFMGLKLVMPVRKMIINGQDTWADKKRGILLVNLANSKISALKEDTALYRLSKDSEYYNMAINNDFDRVSDSSIKSMPLKEYYPIARIGELSIYRHKTNGTYYITEHASGSPPQYGTQSVERMRFYRSFSYVYKAFLNNNIIFENEYCEILFTKYIM